MTKAPDITVPITPRNEENILTAKVSNDNGKQNMNPEKHIQTAPSYLAGSYSSVTKTADIEQLRRLNKMSKSMSVGAAHSNMTAPE